MPVPSWSNSARWFHAPALPLQTITRHLLLSGYTRETSSFAGQSLMT
jgi:hypothetical protein